MPIPDRKPDAVIYPEGFFRTDLHVADRMRGVRRLFAPIFGCGELDVSVKPPLGRQNANFAFNDADKSVKKTLLFPTAHPLARTPRYDWYRATFDKAARRFEVLDERVPDFSDHRGGFLFGWLKPDPYANDEDVLASIETSLAVRSIQALAAQNPAALDDSQFRADLREKFKLTDAEVASHVAAAQAAVAAVATPSGPAVDTSSIDGETA